MSIPREEAARALRQAEVAANRSTTAINYQHASPYLLVWGVVWLVGNLAAYVRAPFGGVLFPALVLVGVAASVWLGLRQGPIRRGRAAGLQSFTIAAAVALFGIGIGIVLPELPFAAGEAVIALAIGAVYIVMGTWIGWRLSAVGFVLMATVIGGYGYAPEQFLLLLALAGGGGLILGGFWMRRV